MKEEDYLDITTLVLTNNEITVIPESIMSLINLQELILSNNQITIIPESISSLEKLRFSKVA